jgi:hypothetical protein
LSRGAGTNDSRALLKHRNKDLERNPQREDGYEYGSAQRIVFCDGGGAGCVVSIYAAGEGAGYVERFDGGQQHEDDQEEDDEEGRGGRFDGGVHGLVGIDDRNEQEQVEEEGGRGYRCVGNAGGWGFGVDFDDQEIASQEDRSGLIGNAIDRCVGRFDGRIDDQEIAIEEGRGGFDGSPGGGCVGGYGFDDEEIAIKEGGRGGFDGGTSDNACGWFGTGSGYGFDDEEVAVEEGGRLIDGNCAVSGCVRATGSCGGARGERAG